MSYARSADPGVQHSDWLRTLEFYKEEIKILQHRLEEVNAKNTGTDVRAGVEHFQNQFIVQRNNIDELRHRVHQHADKALHEDPEKMPEHQQLNQDIRVFEEVVQDLRKEFNLFLSKWM